VNGFDLALLLNSFDAFYVVQFNYIEFNIVETIILRIKGPVKGEFRNLTLPTLPLPGAEVRGFLAR
jgi:hypothetical protein